MSEPTVYLRKDFDTGGSNKFFAISKNIFFIEHLKEAASVEGVPSRADMANKIVYL